MRTCSKTGCRWPAAASLSFRYATRDAWLSDLGEDHPATYDLCPHHAEAQTAPRGWTLADVRTLKEARREPSAAEIAERAAVLRSAAPSQEEETVAVGASRGRRNRYAELVADLPRLAAVHADEHDPDEVIPAPRRPSIALVPPAPPQPPPAPAPATLPAPASPPAPASDIFADLASSGPHSAAPRSAALDAADAVAATVADAPARIALPPVAPAHELAPGLPADAPMDPRFHQLQIPLPGPVAGHEPGDDTNVVPFRRRPAPPDEPA